MSMNYENFIQQQNQTLKKTLDVALKTKFYREKFKKLRIDVSEIKSIEDIHKLPFTTKDDLLNGEEFLPDDMKDMQSIARIKSTSGTTGKQVIIYQSHTDTENYIKKAMKVYSSIGLKAGDRILSLCPYGLTAFFLEDIAFMRMGMFVIQCSTGAVTPSSRVVEIAENLRPNILFSFPSYLLRFGQVAKEAGVLEKLKFEKILTTGEPANKEKIKELFTGADLLENYGSNETRLLVSECKEHIGYHCIEEETHIIELINPETGKKIKEGVGELAVTAFFEATPLIRYKMGDLVEFIPFYNCKCGISSPLIKKVICRIDNAVKIKGNLVYPTTMIEVVDKINGVEDFLITVKKRNDGLDELLIKVKTKSFDVENQIIKEIKQKFNITPVVEIVQQKITSDSAKPKRFVDERKVDI